jgi:hypothetical protein
MTEPVSGPHRPIYMRTLAIAAVMTALFLAGCGDSAGPTASDSADDESRPPMPTTIPAAPGAVATRGVVTVLDDGRPVVCLGPVAESWPPQCGGPPLVGWDWRKQRLVLGQPGAAPAYEQAGAVRWGRYFLTGAWDGRALTVQTAVPEALYDGTAPEPAAAPDPRRDLSQAELEELAADLGGRLPGALSSYVDGGRARIDVVYDDGSLQAWADATHGVGVVVVTPMLVDA